MSMIANAEAASAAMNALTRIFENSFRKAIKHPKTTHPNTNGAITRRLGIEQTLKGIPGMSRNKDSLQPPRQPHRLRPLVRTRGKLAQRRRRRRPNTPPGIACHTAQDIEETLAFPA